MYCIKCGTKQCTGDKFCSKCGTPFLIVKVKPEAVYHDSELNLQHSKLSAATEKTERTIGDSRDLREDSNQIPSETTPVQNSNEINLKHQPTCSEGSKKKGKGLLVGMCSFLFVSITTMAVYFYLDKSDASVGRNSASSPKGVYAIDLGLSVMWASCNVGANSPEEYGSYYAWGETEEKNDYSIETYKYYNTEDYEDIGSNISETSYDVAHVKLGSGWRMPTKDEINELCNKCSWEWTEVNGVCGQKVTGPNGNSIFLPAAGFRYGTEVGNRGSRGYYYYWSGTLREGHSGDAYALYFHSSRHDWRSYRSRYYGLTVRPVTE